jgi:hypothetical protein
MLMEVMEAMEAMELMDSDGPKTKLEVRAESAKGQFCNPAIQQSSNRDAIQQSYDPVSCEWT